jgi:hypothetical protein
MGLMKGFSELVKNFIGAKKVNFIFLTKPSKFETISTSKESKD